MTLSSCVCNAVHCAASEPTWKCQNSFFCVSVINRAAELPSRTSDISGFPMNWELIQTNSQRPQLWIQCFLRPLRGTVVPELILLVILGWFHIFRTISPFFFIVWLGLLRWDLSVKIYNFTFVYFRTDRFWASCDQENNSCLSLFFRINPHRVSLPRTGFVWRHRGTDVLTQIYNWPPTNHPTNISENFWKPWPR